MVRVCGALAMLAVVSWHGSVAAGETSTHPSIRVVAWDTISVRPDQVEIEIGVTTDKKTATAAIAENDRKMEQVLAALKKEVGAEGEVKTSALSVQPRFQETREGAETGHPLGYTVTNMLSVRVTNTKSVGRLLDLAFQAGANTVERVDFTLKDPEAAQNQALRAASEKARARGAAMADAQGLRVGDVLWMSEGETAAPSDGFEPAANVSKYERRASVVAEPGSIQVTATVTVVYALKPR